MVKRLRVMEKKLTNSGPLRESVDKHSIYFLLEMRTVTLLDHTYSQKALCLLANLLT